MIIPDSIFQKMHGLTEEQLMLRETVSDYVNDKIIPNREQLDKEHVYPRSIHDDMCELGILGMGIPEDCEGLGMGMLEAALVYEEISRGCCGVATGVGANSLGSDPILLFGTPEQKRNYLTKVAEGAVAAYGLTEPNAGSDAGGIATVAKLQEDSETWKLFGQKTFITNGGVASIYTIFALTDPTKGPRGASCFIAEVDPDNLPPGIEFPPKFDKMGINASETREIIFDGFEVKTADIVGGKPGRGFLHAMGTFDASRPMIGAMGVGLGRAAFEEALLYAHQRVQFGQPIIKFAGLRNMFIDMWLKVEGARAMVFEGARRVDRKHHGEKMDVTAWSAMAKFMGSEASRVSLEALQATGGYGYMNETPFPKMVRDHKILEIYEGTNQIQREQAALQVIKEFQKTGSAAPKEIEGLAERAGSAGGEVAALAWKITDTVIAKVLEEIPGGALSGRQEVLWKLGEIAGFAESSRILTDACATGQAGADHWLGALGQAYARESIQEVVSRATWILSAGPHPAAAEVAPLLAQASATLEGIFGWREKLGEVLLNAH